MNPYLQDADFTLYNGDALETLRELPAESVQMCVTSPPFFGLRDYGMDGQIGLEPTPGAWVQSLVAVFEQVRRVLRKDGTLWVECGDSYAGSWGAQSREPLPSVEEATMFMGPESQEAVRESLSANQIKAHPKGTRTGSIPPGADYKPKDLIGQPFLLAFALRDAGWYWRNVCIWHKPNPMPESVRDRFTVSHSYVLLFSKSPRYFFDAEAVREDISYAETRTGQIRNSRSGVDTNGGNQAGGRVMNPPPGGRNARSVWTIPTEPLPFEHYAAFPQALAEKAIKAGCPSEVCAGARLIPGTVLDCFGGSGTTALVARRLNRRAILVELNPKYCELIARRTQQLSLEAEADLSPTERAEASTSG